MRIKRTLSALLVGAAALFPAVAIPGQAAALEGRVAIPESCATVGTGWAKVNSAIGEYLSPWMQTARGLDFTREIQFRAGSGALAVRCVNGQAMGAPVPFFYAGQYRERSCLSTFACRTSDFTAYHEGNRGPLAEYRYPGQAVAWDPHYNLFRAWPI
jgi:hypothetical protein